MDFNLFFSVVVGYGVAILYVPNRFLGNHVSTTFVAIRDVRDVSIYLVFPFFVNGSCPSFFDFSGIFF